MIHRKDDIFLGDDTNKDSFDFVVFVVDDEVAIAEDVDRQDTILIFVLIMFIAAAAARHLDNVSSAQETLV